MGGFPQHNLVCWHHWVAVAVTSEPHPSPPDLLRQRWNLPIELGVGDVVPPTYIVNFSEHSGVGTIEGLGQCSSESPCLTPYNNMVSTVAWKNLSLRPLDIQDVQIFPRVIEGFPCECFHVIVLDVILRALHPHSQVLEVLHLLERCTATGLERLMVTNVERHVLRLLGIEVEAHFLTLRLHPAEQLLRLPNLV